MNAAAIAIPAMSGASTAHQALWPAALKCDRLNFRYHRKSDWVINDFTHCFRPGITLIKGASGCGIRLVRLRKIGQPRREPRRRPEGCRGPQLEDVERRTAGVKSGDGRLRLQDDALAGRHRHHDLGAFPR